MEKIDACGLLCPQPLMKLTKALKEIEQGTIVISLDDETAKENVTRSALDRGCTISQIEKEGDTYTITIEKQ